MSRSATVYVCSEDATEVVGTADVVECYLDNEEDPAIILRGVMFDAERVLSSQVHVLQHDVEYYKQARDAECLKSPDRVPGWTITASGFDEAVESCITEDATVPPHEFAERLGVVCVPDPEPTNVELLAELIREIGYDIRHNGRLSGSNALALDLDSRGVRVVTESE